METNNKSCFIIMPISDQEGYEQGHFTRVYNHLLKPACEQAGFNAVRADDEVKANYIVIDMIKKILDSDMVVCDLSSKNPNVLYELGLRQAFNKKVVLIKDIKTTRIFDIQGLRTIDYDETLRIDKIQKNVNEISKALKETFESQGEDFNSLIQLLSIKPAVLPHTLEISKESTLILDALNNISNQLNKLEAGKTSKPKAVFYNKNEAERMKFRMGEKLFTPKGSLGKLVDIHSDGIFVESEGKVNKILFSDPDYSEILPF